MEERRRELADRLGGFRIGCGRELRALADAIGAEDVAAVAIGAWRWRGWVVAATARALHLSRRPRVFGRSRDISWSWTELRQVRARPLGIDLELGGERVELRFVSPPRELFRLADVARRALPDAPPEMETEELMELATTKLGRTLALSLEPTIETVPDRLMSGERVERMAIARLDFEGLLLVTNRRVLLYKVGFWRGRERLWQVDREEVLGAKAVDGDLRLDLAEGPVTLRRVFPYERGAELEAALWRG